MEIKLSQEFDFNDKGSLFGQMDDMNDAIVKDIRESGNSLYIILHKFDKILSPIGEALYQYKELEIEYKYAEKYRVSLYFNMDKRCEREVSISELLDWVKKEKFELEMNDWMITSGGLLLLKLLAHTKDIQRKFKMIDVDIRLLPKKIIYRWKS